MSTQYTSSISTFPLYSSCIINIKNKARIWGITSQNFDLDYMHINSQIRVHGAYGAYNEIEKLWHVEFYVWGKYFGTEPFPFPFPSTTVATIISAVNPAPAPTGPRATNSTPIPNPYPPMYIPDQALRMPNVSIRTSSGTFGPAPGSMSRASISQSQNQHNQNSSPAPGPRNGFTIRGLAASGGSPRYANMGQAYNNRPTRGGGLSLAGGGPVAMSAGGGGLRAENSGVSSGVHGGERGDGARRMERSSRGAVFAARRQLKLSRRTGGRN